MTMAEKKVEILDTTLRDGMHAMAHQFSPKQMAIIAAALDEAHVGTIELGHGDGLAGSSLQYGIAAANDNEYIEAVAKVIQSSRLAVLLLPGIGTKVDLEMAREHGAEVARIATHCTEADIAEQHIRLAIELDMIPMGALMMSHMVDPDKLLEQAKLMEVYGAETVYIMDSAGYMLPDDVRIRIRTLKSNIKAKVGFHAHNNLSLAIANTLAAIEEGADSVDGTLKGLGAGAGNAQIEILIGVLNRQGIKSGVDFYKIMDAAQGVLEPLMPRAQTIDNDSIMIGYSGVYSSFLLHARRAAEQFNVDIRDILVELGLRKTVGGQEDMIIDVATGLSNSKTIRLSKVKRLEH